MSLIFNEILNYVVFALEITSPGAILDRAAEAIRQALNQEENDNRDGMDISLVVIDYGNDLLHFAGARSPLLLLQNGKMTLVKGDPMGVGGEKRSREKPFTDHQVQLGKGQRKMYLFSDGFKDQFGGPENRKFLNKQFNQMLVDHHQLKMSEQYLAIQDTFDRWKGDRPQTDDVMVIGASF
jgi:hypothetical protein